MVNVYKPIQWTTRVEIGIDSKLKHHGWQLNHLVYITN